MHKLQLSSMVYNSTGISKGCVDGALRYKVVYPVQFRSNDIDSWCDVMPEIGVNCVHCTACHSCILESGFLWTHFYNPAVIVTVTTHQCCTQA